MAAQSSSDVIQAALYALGADKIATGDTTNKPVLTLTERVDHVKQALLRWHPWNFAIKRSVIEPVYVTLDTTTENSGFIQVTTLTNHGYATGQRVFIEGAEGDTAANGTWIITVTAVKVFVLNDSSYVASITPGTGTVTLSGTFGFLYSVALPTDCLRVLQNNEDAQQYRIEGRRLLTDDEETNLRYIYDVTDYSTMDPMFYMCLGYFLALDCADRIAGVDSGKKAELHKMLFGGPGTKGILPTSRFVDATEDTLDQIQANDWLLSRGGGANLLASVGRL